MRKFRKYRSSNSFSRKHEWIFLNKFKVFQNGVKIGIVGARDEFEALSKIPERILEKGPVTFEKMFCEV